MSDILIEQAGGNLFLLRPVTTDAAEWLDENVGVDSTWSGAVPVQPRYLQHLLRGVHEAGLTSEWA